VPSVTRKRISRSIGNSRPPFAFGSLRAPSRVRG